MIGYVCERCGREMPEMEGWRSDVGPLCHPDDPDLPDCYSLTSASERGWSLDRFIRWLGETP